MRRWAWSTVLLYLYSQFQAASHASHYLPIAIKCRTFRGLCACVSVEHTGEPWLRRSKWRLEDRLVSRVVWAQLRRPITWRQDTQQEVTFSGLSHFTDASSPRHFGPNAETVRTIGPDTSLIGPGHFGTTLCPKNVHLLGLFLVTLKVNRFQ